MQAIFHNVYGSFDVLGLRELATPTVKDDDVLVRVRAAGLHVGDCFGVRGAPFAIRFFSGLLKPKLGIPGYDVAGQVEAVGKNVKRFRPGDEVFGECSGSCAEYLCATEDELAPKPSGLSFEQAAALPVSALAALHAMRDVAKIKPGQKLLINGASGGVGTYAVHIAKSYGAEVTGVCSTKNVELVRSLGADHIIDYTKEDFVAGGPRFDLILDNVENRALSECRRALTAKGMLILNSGTGAKGIKFLFRLIKPLFISPFVGQRLVRYASEPRHEDLVVLKELVESGALRPVLDKTCSLPDVPAALEYIEGGHARGKVVVTV